MKISSKAQLCNLSPMRKFHPYAVAAKERGVKIYHLNIGQPDIATPKASKFKSKNLPNISSKLLNLGTTSFS